MGAEVRQIIAFDASGAAEDINLHNLGCFCSIFPICLLSKRHYHPYYYYDDTLAARYTDPYPYFLVTHGCVVCLSESGGQAMLLRGEDQVEGYHRHFQTSSRLPLMPGGSWWMWVSLSFTGSTVEPAYLIMK